MVLLGTGQLNLTSFYLTTRNHVRTGSEIEILQKEKLMKLTAENVDKIIRDCLFKDEEVVDGKPPADAVIVDGIVRKFGFHKQRLESHRPEVAEMLADLPDKFMAGKGGGWSFLSMCNTRDGVQWGEHTNMEALMVLGCGLDLVEILVPRAMWAVLPGGVPYLQVKKAA